MKEKLITIGLFLAFISAAQTNATHRAVPVIFMQLLSAANSVLMTNAEFNTTVGNKLYFSNGGTCRAFRATNLNADVLATLHIAPEQLDAQQRTMDAAAQDRKDIAAAQLAEQVRQRNLAIQRLVIANSGAQKAYQQQQEHHRNAFDSTTIRESAGIGAP